MDDQIKICCVVDGKPAEGVLTVAQAQALRTLLTHEITETVRKLNKTDKGVA